MRNLCFKAIPLTKVSFSHQHLITNTNVITMQIRIIAFIQFCTSRKTNNQSIFDIFFLHLEPRIVQKEVSDFKIL